MSRLTRTIYFVLALGGLAVAAADTASASSFYTIAVSVGDAADVD